MQRVYKPKIKMPPDFKIKKLKSIVTNQWEQFCSNTSLHGWKYTVLQKNSKLERYSWVAICLTALGLSFLLLAWTWLKFQSNLTITVIGSTQHAIYHFMFPAVTICSFNKISKSAAYKVANNLKTSNIHNEDSLANSFKLLFYLVNSDDNNKEPLLKQDVEYLHNILKTNNKSEQELFQMIAPSCSRTLKKCMWKEEEKRCDLLFQTIKTSKGYCCSFNYFALKNNTYPRELLNKLSKNPRKTSSCGHKSGLEILVDNEPDNYFATYIPSIGFKVFIHNPYDFPESTSPYIMCEIDSSNFIGVNPEIIAVSKDTNTRPIRNRNCLFSSERKLNYFNQYTFSNCHMECKIDLILELCGCVPFYVHDKTGFYATANVCTLKDIPCTAQIEHLIYNETFMKKRQLERGVTCNCLPKCESVSYIPEASKGVLDATYCTNQFSIYSDTNIKNHTIIRVFFNDLLATKYRRDVSFTWHTLMGYYGGLLGLLTGFNFISVVEIVYFFLIRCLMREDNTKIDANKMMVTFRARKLMKPNLLN